MKIGQFVAQQQLVTVDPEQTLAEAAREMIGRAVGSAVVIAGDEPPGIITERDLLRAVADGVDFDRAKVGQYMVAKAVTVTELARDRRRGNHDGAGLSPSSGGG